MEKCSLGRKHLKRLAENNSLADEAAWYNNRIKKNRIFYPIIGLTLLLINSFSLNNKGVMRENLF